VSGPVGKHHVSSESRLQHFACALSRESADMTARAEHPKPERGRGPRLRQN